MGTHPIFESDFDCLTDIMLRGGLSKHLSQIRKQSQNVGAAVSVKAESFVNGTNAAYVEDMYLSWMEDPKSVHASWNAYFKQVQAGAAPGAAFQAPPSLASSAVYQVQGGAQAAPGAAASSADIEAKVKQNLALENMIRAYQVRGHFKADLDPLGISKGPSSFASTENLQDSEIVPLNNPALAGQEDTLFTVPEKCHILREGETQLPLKEIINRLENAWCNKIGVEFMHITSQEQKEWIRRKFEGRQPTPTPDEQKLTLDRLVRSTKFEEFLAKKWVSEKRFGLEGLEMIIPCMKSIIDTLALNKGRSFVIGMPHRGRLNVLANIIRKDLDQIFCQFDPKLEPTDVGQSGDVKYHLGMSHETINHASKELINVSLCANPSHLEAVDPIVIGKAKAEQFYRGDETGETVCPILLHGDAAFAGQGVVYETFHMSHLPFYSVNGAIHLVCNNQVGFTTDPRHSRASPYCTDVGRVVNAPIFHVNADDPDAVVFVSKVAAEFRQTFHTDVVIDLIGYRKHGHNEIDEPMFTQPLMYQVIKKHKNVFEMYSEQLINQGVVQQSDVEELVAHYEKICEDALAKAQAETKLEFRHWLDSPWKGFFQDDKGAWSADKLPETGVNEATLQRIADCISTQPADITLHGGLKRVLKARAGMAKEKIADWSMGEAMGWGSLLMDGHHVRVSGQDVERGTFSHRHHVLHCQKQDKKVHLPMSTLSPDQADYTVCNSALSEYAVMGFELGYSMVNPNSHVIWEAQFGDFVNTAQCIIDQFLSSGQTKWVRQCGLTVQLPHGYEGMGPEHSSCRVERFLQMQNDDCDVYPSDWESADFGIKQLYDSNWIVANPTTPANCFHIHRRQIALPFRKPLILLTPKSLLRLPEARSKWSEMMEGTSFRRVIPEEGVAAQNPAEAKRLIFCSGKVYYDLVKERAKRGFDDSVAIARIEQLAPFPYDEVIPEMNKYSNAEIYWVQEEHKNMGGYDFCKPRLRTASNWERRVHYAGREPAAAAAAGSKQVHKLEYDKMMNDAFRPGALGRLYK